MKKRILSTAAAALVLMLFLCSLTTVFAAEPYQNPTLFLKGYQIMPGDTFTTTLTIDANAELVGFELGLTYDTDILTLVKAEENERVAGTLVMNTSIPGRIDVTYGRTQNTTKEIPVLDLTFKVDDNIGVGVYDCLRVNPDKTKKADRIVDGKYVEVPLDTDFQTLNIYPTGDIDFNSQVQITDATILRRYLVDLDQLTPFQLKLADTCSDGKTTITDALYIQRKIVSLNVIYGNRANVNFYDAKGDKCYAKSVLYGHKLNRLPAVPKREGFENGRWSATPDSYTKPNLEHIQKDMSLYAVYDVAKSDAIMYYRRELTNRVYSGDLPTGLSSDLNLPARLHYQSGAYADVSWTSSKNEILNSTTGKFTKPEYPSKLILTAQITAYTEKGVIEGTDTIEFVYHVPGKFEIPTKAELAQWLYKAFTYENGYLINYNMKMPVHLTQGEVPSASGNDYEVRIDWTYKDQTGVEKPITQIERTNNAQDIDLIGELTFNGEPLEGDGKVYLDNVHVTAIDESEIKNSIVEQIAAGMGTTMNDGDKLWNADQEYGANIHWETQQVDIATVSDNVIHINSATTNGTVLPITARVSYLADGQAREFALDYTVVLATNNTMLKPGFNISKELYDALHEALMEQIPGFSGNITTAVLRDRRFVKLDLSRHEKTQNDNMEDMPEVLTVGHQEERKITSLKGLSYCTNLHVLDISGQRIEEGMNEICTLSNLEALIAKDCGLTTLSDGKTPVLKNAINLRMLDLSHNQFTNLDSVFAPGVCYSKLQEVYLNDNKIRDLSALKRAPLLCWLSLGNNGLETADIAQLSSFRYLTYLSLANNNIDNIDALSNLIYLAELRLQGNKLTNVRPLQRMIRLQALYLGHNKIAGGIDFLNSLTELRLLYLNDNQLTDISGLNGLTKLQSINVSNNKDLGDLSVLGNYTGTMEEIYAENDSLLTFNFIDGMTKLRTLMVSNNSPEAGYSDLLTAQLSAMPNMEILTLSGKPLHDLNFLKNMPKLARLDVANCRLGECADIAGMMDAITQHYKLLTVLDISNNDLTGKEAEVEKLKNMPNLNVLYADNLCNGFDAGLILREMAQMKYLSLENVGISDLSFASRLRNLVYVDLANNDHTDVDLSAQFSPSKQSLTQLYLDAKQPCAFANGYFDFDGSVLNNLSLEGISVGSMSKLPYMDHIHYLNLANTGITNLLGDKPETYDLHTITRYKTLHTLDVTGLTTDLTPLLDMQTMKVLYAQAEPAEQMFYRTNLHVLQQLYNKGVQNYLYAKDKLYRPVAQTEGTAILALLEDYTRTLTIAAEGRISDNNPVLPESINDYPITWTISNNTNYEVRNNQIAVKDYTNIDNETMTLTAEIRVYPDQAVTTREYQIDTVILRPAEATRSVYYQTRNDGFGREMQRGTSFYYDVALRAGKTEGFSEEVKPVADEIRYNYDSKLADGAFTPYGNVIAETASHAYTIQDVAPLQSTTTIQIEIGHNKDGSFVADDTLRVSFKVVERAYTITYVTNGGKVLDETHSEIDHQSKSEEAILFQDITVKRDGYLFEGWYTDPDLTNLFWSEGHRNPMMPSHNLTLYAKWKAHSYTIRFNGNGGSTSTPSKTVLCGVAIGELPVPTRAHHSFTGWYTDPNGGELVTEQTVRNDASDITLYAHWQQKSLSGWVLASDAPGDAKIEEQKWTYTQTTTTESRETSLPGYQRTGNDRWIECGSAQQEYAYFPSTFDSGNWIYTSMAKGPVQGYENETNRRTVTDRWGGYIYWHWMYNVRYANSENRMISHRRGSYDEWGTPGRGFAFVYFYAMKSSVNCRYLGNGYCCSQNLPSYYCHDILPGDKSPIGIGTPRFFRFDYRVSDYVDYYKMFQYRKVENKESRTEVKPSDTISNVKKYVRYRPR